MCDASGSERTHLQLVKLFTVGLDMVCSFENMKELSPFLANDVSEEVR